MVFVCLCNREKRAAFEGFDRVCGAFGCFTPLNAVVLSLQIYRMIEHGLFETGHNVAVIRCEACGDGAGHKEAHSESLEIDLFRDMADRFGVEASLGYSLPGITGLAAVFGRA